MTEPTTSPLDAFYTVGLEPPQKLNDRAGELKRYLETRGMTTDPIPPTIVLTCHQRCPSPPVTGRLPRCDSVPKIGRRPVIADIDPVHGWPWLVWPVDLGPWYAALRASLIAPNSSDDNLSTGPEIPIPGSFIPLASFHDKGMDPDGFASILRDEEIKSLLIVNSGWRSMRLSCRRIDVTPNRPWYLSAYWRTVWIRRLRRAPKIDRRLV